mmetsp:Transcript_57787/g.135683  ORF Transcript_57787/g.135683 Transcript_57787/m.135683 type:complete len:301 (+) Transcript_57787:764-1666(+)
MERAVLTVRDVALVGGVQAVAGARLVHLEVLVADRLEVLVRVHADLVVLVRVRDRRVHTDRAVLLVVHRADLEALLVAADQTRLLAPVARGAAAHHRRLDENARAAVGIGAVLGVDGGEGDGVLVVLPEMEVAREPRLDAAVLAHQLDELAALLLVRVVEPAAAIDDVVLLQHAQARAVGGGVREDEDLPALGRGVLLQDLLEPQHLLIVDGDLVRGVLGAPEHGRAEADEQRLLSDLALELRGLLAVLPEVHRQVGLVGIELVKTLEVMVAADDLVRHRERTEVFGRHLVALGGAREKL